MDSQKERAEFLACEDHNVFLLLIMCGGMMGAYTFNVRGGVFCNAQTANIVLMSIAFGKGQWAHAFYFLIPIFAYFMGALISEVLPSPVKRLGLLRWDTCLILMESIILFLVGFVPLSVPHQVVQVTINFIASMQYNTFRQAEGIPMATTFCTNHVRQVGIAVAKAIRRHDTKELRRGSAHFRMLLSFLTGGIVLTVACRFMQEKAIWLALIPMLIILGKLVYADLTIEHDLLEQKPKGH